jgi:hypothetical protein
MAADSIDNPVCVAIDVESLESPEPEVFQGEMTGPSTAHDRDQGASTAAVLASLSAAPTNWHQAMICELEGSVSAYYQTRGIIILLFFNTFPGRANCSCALRGATVAAPGRRSTLT